MKLHVWDNVPIEPLNDLLGRQVIHTGGMTVAHIFLRKGAVVPRHSHPNEQVSIVRAGRLLFQFDDSERIVEAGHVMEIAPGLPHRVEALEDSVALDLFTPARQDWITGDDAYLRQK
jgi:quercetin dioxygenase-like cupin family protein